VHSLEYTDISKVFFMPDHVYYCWTNVIQGHCCTIRCSSHTLDCVRQFYLLFCIGSVENIWT
jgi:hypothetical protein